MNIEQQEPTVLTFKHFGREYQATLPWDVTLTEIIDVITTQLLAMGYHPDTIKQAFTEAGEE